MSVPSGVSWRRAAAISERGQSRLIAADDRLSSRRVRQWAKLPVFTQQYESWDPALEPLGVSRDELVRLLGQDEVHFSADFSESDSWNTDFERMWRSGLDAVGDDDRVLGLLEVLYPLVTGARNEFLAATADLIKASPADVRDLLATLGGSIADNPPFDELGAICGPTMILELNVAREEGKLAGENPEERFDDFLLSLRDPKRAREILDEYPVVERLATTRLKLWRARGLELMARFSEDVDALTAAFWGGKRPESISAQFGSGDSHRQGRSVAILHSPAGQVVYKPRSSILDVGFDGVISWFNSTGPRYTLTTPTLIPRGDYGWFEFIDGGTRTDSAGADRFAWRAGALTALLHFLRATDFHFENIVAAGELPVAVDLETLLHVDKQGSNAAGSEDSRLTVGFDALAESVYSIGILPTKIITGDPSNLFAVDISAIGGAGGQASMFETPTVRDDGTDHMHVTPGRASVDAQLNRPLSKSNDEQHNIVQRYGHFAEGFAWAYDIVAANKSDWISPDGLLSAFEGAGCRTIARPTAVYGKLLMESYHPDFMRDALDRDMCLSKLLAGYHGRDDRNAMIAAELDAARIGDIPFFEVDASTGGVTDGVDSEVLVRRSRSPLAVVREFMAETVGAKDRSEQLRIIKYSFAAASNGGVGGLGAPRTVSAFPELSDAPDALTCAVELAHKLIEQSFDRDGYRGWIGLTFLAEQWWTVNPAGSDMYTGLSGIALSLAAVGEVSGDDEVTGAARQLFEQLALAAEFATNSFGESGDRRLPAALDAGGYGVVGGLMYALSSASVRYGDERYALAANGLLAPLAEICRKDENYDVVAGVAGAMLATLALIESGVGSTPDARRVLEICLERLENGAITDGVGTRWPAAGGSTPLVGYSHGCLGVAVALARLTKWDERYRDRTTPLIEGAMDFERAHWNPATGDWDDLREESVGSEVPMRSWCHGSAGGILGRTALLSSETDLESDQLVREINSGLLATEESTRVRLEGPYGQGNHSICHGDLGNLVCSLVGLKSVGGHDDIVQSNAVAWANSLIEGKTNGWRSSSPLAVETPGLMMGLAGIAWALAFKASGGTEPNLLLLEANHSYFAQAVEDRELPQLADREEAPNR